MRLDAEGPPGQGTGGAAVAGRDDGELRVDSPGVENGQPLQRVKSGLCQAKLSKVRTDTLLIEAK